MRISRTIKHLAFVFVLILLGEVLAESDYDRPYLGTWTKTYRRFSAEHLRAQAEQGLAGKVKNANLQNQETQGTARQGEEMSELKNVSRRDFLNQSLAVAGAAGDRLVQAGKIDSIAKAVELAKAHDLPVGVGGHSLLVPMTCEKHQVPCDFYVKTLHSDNYPSATPKESRKEFIWLDGGEGWYDNMWCINRERASEPLLTGRLS